METTTNPKLVKEDSEIREARTNGLNEEQLAAMLALAGRFADDSGFIERGRVGTAEFRRRVQEEAERVLDEEERK